MSKEKVIMRDNEGSWFLIPTHEVETFKEMDVDICAVEFHSDDWYSAIEAFDAKFLTYGIDSPIGLFSSGQSWF